MNKKYNQSRKSYKKIHFIQKSFLEILKCMHVRIIYIYIKFSSLTKNIFKYVKYVKFSLFFYFLNIISRILKISLTMR